MSAVLNNQQLGLMALAYAVVLISEKYGPEATDIALQQFELAYNAMAADERKSLRLQVANLIDKNPALRTLVSRKPPEGVIVRPASRSVIYKGDCYQLIGSKVYLDNVLVNCPACNQQIFHSSKCSIGLLYGS